MFGMGGKRVCVWCVDFLHTHTTERIIAVIESLFFDRRK